MKPRAAALASASSLGRSCWPWPSRSWARSPGQAAHLGGSPVGPAERQVGLDDPLLERRRLGVLSVERDQQPVGLASPLVAGLVEHRVGETAQHLLRVALAADLGQEAEGVVRGLAVVFGEQLDQVVQRLILQLCRPLLLLGALFLGLLTRSSTCLKRVAASSVCPSFQAHQAVLNRARP